MDFDNFPNAFNKATISFRDSLKLDKEGSIKASLEFMNTWLNADTLLLFWVSPEKVSSELIWKRLHQIEKFFDCNLSLLILLVISGIKLM